MQSLAHMFRQAVLLSSFTDSKSYWERRYRFGGTSGEGSGGRLAAFKAEVLNAFVRDNAVDSVVEFGCGDGRQLALADYPRYLGLDVSRTIIMGCKERFADDPSKSFLWYDPAAAVNIGPFIHADLALSLDVIYHLVENESYDRYLIDLFTAARRFVIVYSSDKEAAQQLPHVRHRNFTRDVAQRFPNFVQRNRIDNRCGEESFCSFFVFASDEKADIRP